MGDRFARRERDSLPRACSALKSKPLRVACVGVDVLVTPPLQPLCAAVELPAKLRASHWEGQLARVAGAATHS